MRTTITNKVQTYMSSVALFKDSAATNNLFAGRNLPSFVKDYLLKRYARGAEVDAVGLTNFLNSVMPTGSVRDRLQKGEEIMLLTRFTVYIDLVKNVRRFGITDLGIKEKEGQIPLRLAQQHPELVDGEMWGIIKICLMPDDTGDKYHVEMTDFKPFRPYTSVDMSFIQGVRRHFELDEWVDLLISSIEYEPDAFDNMHQKLEFLTRLLIFVEPRLNAIELAPKGTGKSYVFNNISKYGWLGSGKITRAKLFYDISKKQTGIIMNRDYCALDEVQTIVMQDPADLQGAFKSYLEQGKVSIADQNLTSECGMLLMGNIPLTEDNHPRSPRYFDELPDNFRESAFLDRFHCFIEGWYLPRINKSMIYKGWTINVEYFSEIMHAMRVQNQYSQLFDKIVGYEEKADMRDFTAVKRMTTAYMKLLFPHWQTVEDVNCEQFDLYCLQPAIRRRGIIREQCHLIDPEFKTRMPDIWVKKTC